MVGLAESHRAPFDAGERESELVSGFLREYGGQRFIRFMLYEYIVMIVFCYTVVFLFFTRSVGWFRAMWIFSLLYLYVWCRATLPRIRFDVFIHWAWEYNVPILLVYNTFVFIV